MKWTDDFLNPMRLVMDPVADELVSRIAAEQGHEGTRWLFHILIRNIDMPFDQVPGYVRDYMDQNGQIPPEVDMERVRRGQAVFLDLGAWFALALLFKSLPTAYLDKPGVKVLHFTGRTEKGREWPQQYARRLVETTQFVLDVMAPGNLESHAKGVQTALKVRLVHASIRYFFLNEGARDSDATDNPINQEDLALTLMTFSVSLIEAAAQLGRPLSAGEADDYFYAWRAVGMLLGIRPEMIPDNYEDGKLLLERILERLAAESPEGRSLTSALLEFSNLLIPGRLADDSSEVLLLFFMGEERARMLGVEPRQGCISTLLPAFLKGSFNLSEKREDRDERIARRSNQLGILIIRALMNRMMKLKDRSLEVPAEFRRQWGV